jgi:hypothetical protein
MVYGRYYRETNNIGGRRFMVGITGKQTILVEDGLW